MTNMVIGMPVGIMQISTRSDVSELRLRSAAEQFARDLELSPETERLLLERLTNAGDQISTERKESFTPKILTEQERDQIATQQVVGQVAMDQSLSRADQDVLLQLCVDFKDMGAQSVLPELQDPSMHRAVKQVIAVLFPGVFGRNEIEFAFQRI
jgi:hypothetical protein